MSKTIHVAIASTTSKPGDTPDNLAQIEEMASRAAADGADLLLTPEMSACGYGPYPEVLETAEPAGEGPIYQGLAKIAASTGVVILAGFVEAANGKRHLSHYVVYPDGKFVVQRKHKVTFAERPLESPVECILQGDEVDPADCGQPTQLQFNYFDINGVKCGLTICADGGIRDVNKIFADNGVELRLTAAGAGGEREHRVTTEELYTDEGRAKYLEILKGVFLPAGVTECIKYRLPHAAVNMCGFDGKEKYHVGHGTITNAMGEVLALIHGLPNIDRQKPMYTHAEVDVEDCLPEKAEE